MSTPEGNINTVHLQGNLAVKGDPATVEIGTVTTGAEGTNASVTNSGTKTHAKLDFVIPIGNTGATGNGILDIAKTGTSGLVDTYTVFMTDGSTYTITVTNANAGSAYTKTETNQLLSDKVDKTSIINEITGSAVTGDDSKVASLAATKGLKISVGDLSNLTTTQKSNLVAAINELVTADDNLSSSIGTLSNLTTTQKSNLVAAINELVSNLSTKQKTILVGDTLPASNLGENGDIYIQYF